MHQQTPTERNRYRIQSGFYKTIPRCWKLNNNMNATVSAIPEVSEQTQVQIAKIEYSFTSKSL